MLVFRLSFWVKFLGSVFWVKFSGSSFWVVVVVVVVVVVEVVVVGVVVGVVLEIGWRLFFCQKINFWTLNFAYND